ncbi:MAG: hypothetical protein OXH52_07715 [Gammaproteobacteria bacterium]|nr:hypothetical protein [Gammaproteobacteria bacterium]
MSFTRFPQALGNTNGPPLPAARAASRICSVRRVSGTRCSRFNLVRVAGTVHTCSSVLISAHSAPRTSPELAAVHTRNSNARLTVAVTFDARTFSITCRHAPTGQRPHVLDEILLRAEHGPIRLHGLLSQ